MAEMDDTERVLHEKWEQLKNNLQSLGRVAVAFSGGVDSTFLLSVAQDVLGEDAMAITANPHSFPGRELEEARAFCRARGIRHDVYEWNELALDAFCENPPNRCYLCKRELFGKMIEIAREQKITHVIEGSNMDDSGDYRPGMQAVSELGIESPLREAGLYKEEIRRLSKEMGLPTWEKPSFACLASRFVYGERITEEKLSMVEQAEQLLLDRGFRQARVRIHGRMARIEVLPEEFGRLLQGDTREELAATLKSYGFSYISMDLEGYRTGSMNEILKRQMQ